MGAKVVIQEFINLGARQVTSPSEVRGDKINYIVANGDKILTIGEGNPNRLKGLMRSSTLNKHNKAFIVAASEVVFGGQNTFYFLAQPSKEESKRLETELKDLAGGDLLIPNHSFANLPDFARFLWDQLKGHCDTRLDAAMELVLMDGDAFRSAWLHAEFGPQLRLILKNYYRS